MSIARGTVVTTAVIAATALVVGLGAAAQADDSPTPTAAPSASAAPATTATPSPSASPTATATPKPTGTPTPTATPKPTATPTPTPKPKPTWVYMEKVMRIGTSVRGRPIVARYKGYRHAKRVLVVLGQMHGDEPAGTKVALSIRHHLKPKKGTGVWIIDTMNPDGGARGTRVNARGVDLNRNWPTRGFTSKDKGTKFWGGPAKASEPETRAVRDFLIARKPDYIASFHQPFGVIAKHKEDPAWQRRLSRNLKLPLETVGIGSGGVSGQTNPTLTSWYNKSRLGKYGTATTIELPARISDRTIRRVIAPGTLRAALVL